MKCERHAAVRYERNNNYEHLSVRAAVEGPADKKAEEEDDDESDGLGRCTHTLLGRVLSEDVQHLGMILRLNGE